MTQQAPDLVELGGHTWMLRGYQTDEPWLAPIALETTMLHTANYRGRVDRYEVAAGVLYWRSTDANLAAPPPDPLPAGIERTGDRFRYRDHVVRVTGEVLLSASTREFDPPDLVLELAAGAVTRIRWRTEEGRRRLAGVTELAIEEDRPWSFCGASIDRLATRVSLAGSSLVPEQLPAVPERCGWRELDLSSTGVVELSSLRAARALRTLRLCHTRVRDLRPLAALPHLETLDLTGAECLEDPDLAPLLELRSLRHLRLEHTQVTDTTMLAPLELDELRVTSRPGRLPAPDVLRIQEALDISDQTIADLAPLALATNLQTLRAARSNLVDLAPLADLEGLEHLDISHTRVTSLDPLDRHRSLITLDISGSEVRALGPALRCELSELTATNAPVSDLVEAPAAWSRLRALRISGTRIGPLPDLRSLDWLEVLEIDHLDQPDLACIERVKLKRLSIAHTGITDLTPTRKASLETLDLRWALFRSLSSVQLHQWTLRSLALDVDQLPMLAELRDMLITEVVIEGRNRAGDLPPGALRGLRCAKHLARLELVECCLEAIDELPSHVTLVLPAATPPEIIHEMQARGLRIEGHEPAAPAAITSVPAAIDEEPGASLETVFDPSTHFTLGEPLWVGIGATAHATATATATPITVMEISLMQADGVPRAIDEARAAAEVDPVFVRVIEHHLADRTLHLVLEPVAGRSLAELDGPLPIERIRAIFEPLYRAVAAAHGRELVHGLICPLAVLVDEGTVKLFDVGARRLAMIGGMKHRFPYLAPESLRGEDCAATDSYGLAASLWFALTGHRRGEGDSFGAVREHRREVPRALDAVLARSLAPTPVERPDVATAWRELEPHLVRRRWWQR